MTPEPSPALLDEEDSTDTTEGSSVAATCSTEPSAGAALLVDTDASWVSVWLAEPDAESEVTLAPSAPAPNPAASAKITVPATTIVVRRPRFAGRGACSVAVPAAAGLVAP